MVWPIGFLKPRYFTHASLIMKPDESLGRDGSKSRPSFISHLTVLPNSGETAKLLKFSCKAGSLPCHIKPPLVEVPSVIRVSELETDATTPLVNKSFLTASYFLTI